MQTERKSNDNLITAGTFLEKGSTYDIILPVDVYGCETWSLKLREERRLKVFENRVLRRIFGPNGGMEKIT
jgi:hypothetical protein